jgi:hypothetical protein
MIGLDAPMIVTGSTTIIQADGGGGGGGGSLTAPGEAGSDSLPSNRAPGGPAGTPIAGDGGDGSSNTGNPTGGKPGTISGPPDVDLGSGGGGGGGAGVVFVVQNVALEGHISPMPMHP